MSDDKPGQPVSQGEHDHSSPSSVAPPATASAPLPGTPLAQESSGASDITVIKAERGIGGDVSPCTQLYDERMEDVEEEREPLTAKRMSMDVDREQPAVGQQPQPQPEQFRFTQDHRQQDSLCYEVEKLEKDAGGAVAASSGDEYFSISQTATSMDDEKSLDYLTHSEQQQQQQQQHNDDYASLFTTTTPFSTPFSAGHSLPMTATSPYIHMEASAFGQQHDRQLQQTSLMGLGVSLPPRMSMLMPHGGSYIHSDEPLPPAFAAHDHNPQQLRQLPMAMHRLGSVDLRRGYPLSIAVSASMGGANEGVFAISGDLVRDSEMEAAVGDVPTSSAALDSLHGFVGMM